MVIRGIDIQSVELPKNELDSFDMHESHFVIKEKNRFYTVPNKHRCLAKHLYEIV